MTLQTCNIILAGLTLIGAKDGEQYYVAVPELEKALGWVANTGRKKLTSKSLETFAGKKITVGKIDKNKGNDYTLLRTQDTSLLLA